MSARTRNLLRIGVLLGWLVLALITVAPVLAQDGGTPQSGGQDQAAAPGDLNEVAARLAPLAVGAALIERTLEFLFSWAQRAVLDASSSLRGLAARISGLIKLDFRQGWEELDRLTNALVKVRAGIGGAQEVVDPNSPDPSEWPLEQLETRLAEVEQTLTETEVRLQALMGSDLYKQRKKMTAAVLSIVMGVGLAFIANLRLFQALDVEVANWFEGPYEYVDMALAGVLMGLGTDWVHQVINLLTKGQSFLGRAGTGGSELDPASVKLLVAETFDEQFKHEFDAQLRYLREQAEREIHEITRGGASPST